MSKPRFKLKSTLMVGGGYRVITEAGENQMFIFDGEDNTAKMNIRVLPTLEKSFLLPSDKVYSL
jgi:hypothetical protein